MSTELEIERKFLVEFPDFKDFDVVSRRAIIQTYLESENGNQRRVRKIDCDGAVSYTYTEKVFITPVTRNETEYEISEQEYMNLLKQAKKDFVPVEKVRYVFEYKNQFFELDTYPYSDKLAILELELDSPQQEIFFPDFIKVLGEVTGDSRYSNSALAVAGCFPE